MRKRALLFSWSFLVSLAIFSPSLSRQIKLENGETCNCPDTYEKCMSDEEYMKKYGTVIRMDSANIDALFQKIQARNPNVDFSCPSGPSGDACRRLSAPTENLCPFL